MAWEVGWDRMIFKVHSNLLTFCDCHTDFEICRCIDKFLMRKSRCFVSSGLHDTAGSCAAHLFAVNLRTSHLKGSVLRLCCAMCGGTRMSTHELCCTYFFPHISHGKAWLWHQDWTKKGAMVNNRNQVAHGPVPCNKRLLELAILLFWGSQNYHCVAKLRITLICLGV